MASLDSSAARANASADHEAHFGSSVTRSRMTLLSRSVTIHHFRVNARISSVDILTPPRAHAKRRPFLDKTGANFLTFGDSSKQRRRQLAGL